ncbi:MAG: hypothetical protein HRT38_05685 [Alteromonadaceae bacterium]|nr:hypothetical protein [Alteromonadaceae bacterium]
MIFSLKNCLLKNYLPKNSLSKNKSVIFGLFTFSLLFSTISSAQEDKTSQEVLKQKSDILIQLKNELQKLQQLQQSYQDKINQLEERLVQAEQAIDSTQDDVSDTQDELETLAIDVSQQGNQKAANTFNPGIGMILNGRWLSYSDDFEYKLPGYFPTEESGPGEQGAQLGESELNLNANVDDKFYASVTLAFGDGVEVEEAYIQTINLDHGINVKAGQFFSGIGYLSGKHSHSDDFANRPLPYEAFLGGGFGDVGLQTTWLAPTELFWESGIELYRGDSFPTSGASNSGNGVWTAFSHLGGDITDAQSWRFGLSYLHADVENRETEEGEVFTGTNKLLIADFVYKWSPDGNRGEQEFKLQGEYFNVNENGFFSGVDNELTNASFERNQSGWYLEGVYRFARQWRVGVRTSALSSDNLSVQFNGTLLDNFGYSPEQHSLMLDWTNSEFSRIRLQVDHNNFDDEQESIWILQYIAAFGAHGAHSF